MQIKLKDTYLHSFSFTQDEVVQFAKITGDTNPLHLDEEFAAQNIYGKTIIHGMLSAGIFSKVLGVYFPGAGTIYISQSLVFLKPMYTLMQYEARFTIIEIIANKKKALIKTEVWDTYKNECCISGEAWVKNSLFSL